MTARADVATETRRLRSRLPVIGGWMRGRAERRLRSLRQPDEVDALCRQWAQTRDPALQAIVRERRYVASGPRPLRVLSALVAGRTDAAAEGLEDVPLVVAALGDRDAVVRGAARAALMTLTNPLAVDAFCERALRADGTALLEIARAAGHAPSDPDRRVLFLLLSGQVRRYLDADFEFQRLGPIYVAADDALRRRIEDAIRRSGEVKLLGLFQRRRGLMAPAAATRKRAGELTDREAGLMLEVYRRKRAFAEIFRLMPQIPLWAVVSALDILRAARWQPEDAAARELLVQLFRLRASIRDTPAAPHDPGSVPGALVDRWIERARNPDWRDLSAPQLFHVLLNGTPPDAITAMAVLLERAMERGRVVELVSAHRHWLVRLAFLACGERHPALLFGPLPAVQGGGELWLQRLRPALVDAVVYRSRVAALRPDHVDAIRMAVGEGPDESLRKAYGRVAAVLGRHVLSRAIEADADLMVDLRATDVEVDVE